MKKLVLSLVAVCLGLAVPATAFAGDTHEQLQERVNAAKLVLSEILNTPDNSIPLNILNMARCVAVIPSLKKGAFLVGAEYGRGIVSCRTGHGWSAPAFITLAGGSFGFQAGGQSTDLVLVAVNDHGMQELLKDKFKIGGDVGASAGPVGRNSQAATDWKMGAELLTYSRSKGLFAGVDLNGASVSQSTDDTETYYGQAHTFQSILKGSVPVPEGAKPFVREVAHAFVDARANH